MRTGKLTALAVRKATKPGRYGDGGNLYLHVRPNGSRCWIVRYALPGRKPRDMGLGSADDVPLAAARDKARQARDPLRDGKDPIEVREAARQAAVGDATTFRDLATTYVATHKVSWKNEKHQAQWTSTLETYAYPTLGDVPLTRIGVADLLRVLQPIWTEKTETASRLRGRIEKVLDYAKATGLRSGDNPATWRGNLSALLPAPGRIAPVEHHPAMDWRDCPAFMAELAKRGGAAALALRFTILTAARTGMTIGAVWGWVDAHHKEWLIPGIRMKGDKDRPDFYVPLSTAALAVLDVVRLPDARPGDVIFPGDRPGTGLSNMAMLMLLERMGRADITVHGFRSSFRDWAALETTYKREVVEAALAHTNKDKTEAAYLRTDMLELRAALMEDWAEFLSRPFARDDRPARRSRH